MTKRLMNLPTRDVRVSLNMPLACRQLDEVSEFP
jgi:hypothetical protein